MLVVKGRRCLGSVKLVCGKRLKLFVMNSCGEKDALKVDYNDPHK